MGKQVIVILLAAMNFTHIIDVMIIMPLGDVFIDEFSLSAFQFTTLVSAYAIGAALSSVLGAFILDRFDRKAAILAAYAGFVVGTLLCGVTWSYFSFVSFRFITGIFGGIIGALALSIVSDLYQFKERGKAIGILMTAFSVATAVGMPIGLYIASLFDWRTPFFFLAAVGAIVWTSSFFALPQMKDHILMKRVKPKEVIYAITSDMNQKNALLLGMILVMGHFFIIPYITPYMSRNVGLNETQIIYMYLLGGVLTVFTGPLIGRITDRFGALRTFYIIVILSFIPVILITHMKEVSVVFALMVTSLFFIFGSGRMIAPNTMITAAVGPSNRASFMSVKSALQQLAVALASLVAGLIVVLNEEENLTHYEYVGYLSILFCIFAMFVAPKLKIARGN